jgi:cellulose biosynthesis protein BcsQ
VNILAVLSQKGGTGESTLVRSIAVAGLLDQFDYRQLGRGH